jgi:hypothetical protein
MNQHFGGSHEADAGEKGHHEKILKLPVIGKMTDPEFIKEQRHYRKQYPADNRRWNVESFQDWQEPFYAASGQKKYGGYSQHGGHIKVTGEYFFFWHCLILPLWVDAEKLFSGHFCLKLHILSETAGFIFRQYVRFSSFFRSI